MSSDDRSTGGAEAEDLPEDLPEALRTPIRQVTMGARKRIVLIGHDNRKHDLLEWARFNRGTLEQHELYGTGTTGELLSTELGLNVHRFLSGPLGGDQQVGAGIAEGRIDLVIFFWDPLQSQPHDVDVKALLRIAVVHNTPIACNRATADFILSTPLMDLPYERIVNAAERFPS
jgi:methylglyoxal synthase